MYKIQEIYSDIKRGNAAIDQEKIVEFLKKYDSLFNKGLISEETYDACLQIIEDKREMILSIINKEAWKYKFAYTWGKPDSIDINDYMA